MARRYADRIGFVGMAGRDDEGPMREFVDRYGLGGFPHVIDRDGSLWGRFGVAYQPAWAFVDDTGEVEVVPGVLSGSQLERRLDELIAS